MILSKDAILAGAKKVEKVKIEALGGEIYLRPLTAGELHEIEAIEAKAMGTFETNEKSQRGRRQTTQSNVESKGKINLAKATQASAEANIRKLELSMNNDKCEDVWSKEDIESLESAAFNEILEKVNDLSGIDISKEDVENFP